MNVMTKKDMTICRTDIEKALDEMISNEEGMRFQGLAVVLAKLKWPEFIASERHNDLGLDAYAPACDSNSTEKGLASSITATINKIKEDIERFKPHYPNVKVLIFATPRKVTNQQAKIWKETIWKDYGIELQIVSKEDVITDLMLPVNASICSSHLNIHVAVEQTTQDLVAKAREATGEILAAWLAHPRLAGKPKIALQSVKLEETGRETQEVVTLDYFQQALLEGRRIILEAPAGRGKTTTLIQLTERMRQVSFLIDLPIWIESNKGIFDFISQMPQFLSRRINTTALTQIYNTVPCSFLLNGWNEVSDSCSDKAVHVLADLERNFPKAGIIVATRAHHINPPLPGSLRVRLLPLNRRQRVDYLNQALASRAGKLIFQLENDRVLDDLTRTPLILSEVVNIFLSGAAIPKTKTGILDAVVRLAEESGEHRDHLARPPLLGKSRDYLADLAVQMTKSGTVTMEETCSRSVVSSVSRKLQAEGQIVTLPEPAEVLSALCAHHVLERLEYPSVTFRFQHQQFQEWHVSIVLRKYLLELVDKNNQEMNRNFMREYINIPLWEEPLRMIAEDIGGLNADSSNIQTLLKVGSMLVEFALEVDPVFAAELARLCGNKVWIEMKDRVGQRLRSWNQVEGDSDRRCALAGMIASGSEDFKDILLPLLTSDNQQVRLRTYRSFREFYISSLGEDWKQIVTTWEDEHRVDFIGEIVREPYMAGIAEEFARVDSSSKVRAAALGVLEWTGATEALNRVLSSYNDDTFKEVLCKRILHEIPQEARPRAIAIYNMLLQEIDDPKERIRIRLAILELGGEFIIEGIKEELTKWPSERISDGEELLIKSAIEIVRKSEPDWVSHWIAERIIKGVLWNDRWITFISSLTQDFKQNLLKRISEEALGHRDNSAIVSILVATADSDLVGDVFSRLCSLRNEASDSFGKIAKTQWDIIRQLQELFRAMPPDVAISGMLGYLSSKFNSVELQVTIELLGRIGDTGSDLRSQLPDDIRQALRTYLKGGLPFVLNQDDFNGSLKSELATALARVGDPEDMDDLNKFIQADIERVRRGREAWRKGDRGPMGNGGVMSYSNWHVRAVECLDSRGAEDIFLRILCEPEYEREAAGALIRLARINNSKVQHVFKKKDYRILWDARYGRLKSNFDEDRRCRYATAIKQRIGIIKEQRSQSDKPDLFNGRLKMLACLIATLDSHNSSDLVMEIMALPGEWDGYTRVEALEALLFSGALIKADEALKVINPSINHIIQPSQFHDQQNRFLLQRCLCLLPFFDPPSLGIQRIGEIITTTQIPSYDLRELLLALGNSRCDEALNLLLDICTKYGNGLNQFRSEWVEAIVALNTFKARQILVSFVDSKIEVFKTQLNFEYHDRERLARHIADIASEDPKVKGRVYELCKTEHSPVARSLLAGIVSQIGTSEAFVAGLSLIQDQPKPSIPYDLSRGLESVFLGRQPYGAGYGYTIEPTTANEIRSRLYEMTVGDDNRKRSAWELLGQIESWRLEYGRPDSEPRHPAFESGKPWPPIVQRDKSLRSTVTYT
ncbi:NACHT domain-containing protein [Candidatus Omnitrophota bacterium]